jgi:hypothetical protein
VNLAVVFEPLPETSSSVWNAGAAVVGIADVAVFASAGAGTLLVGEELFTEPISINTTTTVITQNHHLVKMDFFFGETCESICNCF